MVLMLCFFVMLCVRKYIFVCLFVCCVVVLFVVIVLFVVVVIVCVCLFGWWFIGVLVCVCGVVDVIYFSECGCDDDDVWCECGLRVWVVGENVVLVFEWWGVCGWCGEVCGWWLLFVMICVVFVDLMVGVKWLIDWCLNCVCREVEC